MSKKTTAKTAKRSAAKRARPAASRTASARRATIQAWQTDPMGGLPILQRPAPVDARPQAADEDHRPGHRRPRPACTAAGSAGFRYWTAAEVAAARRRVLGGRRARRPGTAMWAPTLPVRLDDGVDLNAYYARTDFPAEDIKQGLSFFHDTVRDVTSGRNVTVFSGGKSGRRGARAGPRRARPR
jgi:hypothetical protein